MLNLYRQFASLLPRDELLVGSVLDTTDGLVTVQLPGGEHIRVRGEAAPGERVFVRGGAIDGPAPSLPLVELTV